MKPEFGVIFLGAQDLDNEVLGDGLRSSAEIIREFRQNCRAMNAKFGRQHIHTIECSASLLKPVSNATRFGV